VPVPIAAWSVTSRIVTPLLHAIGIAVNAAVGLAVAVAKIYY
jgi:hypothetical protein